MYSTNSKILLSTTLIILIGSVECCIYAKNLIDLGTKVLKATDDVKFNDYEAVEELKDSVKFATQSSNIAVSEVINELLNLTRVPVKNRHILNATNHVEHHFNTLLSLLTPLNGYDAQHMESAIKNVSNIDLMKSSTALMQLIFTHRPTLRRITSQLAKKPHDYHCRTGMSPYQKIVGLYNRALLNLIMGFTSMIYSSKQSYRFEPQLNTTITPHYLMKLYKSLTTRPTNRIHFALKNVSQAIHPCDPYEHEHEKTFDRLYELVESYLTSEQFLSADGKCHTSPQIYHNVQHSNEIHKYIDESLVCYGTLYKCVNVDLKHVFLYGNDYIYRRYHGFTLNDKSSPDGETLYGYIGDATIGYTKDELNGIYSNSAGFVDPTETNSLTDDTTNCPIYRCSCDSHQSPRTTRYFSTKIVTANIKRNRVITGLRLRVINRVVYIQIQTGILNGIDVVDPSTVKWKKITEVTIEHVDEYSPNTQFVALNYNNRSLYLDDVIAPVEYYLTGVRFARANGGVHIAGEFTSFHESKHLRKYYAPVDHKDHTQRLELKIDNNVPTSMIELGMKPISTQNKQYIKFQPSNLKTDAGQTTVPFLDIQPVVSDPPSALGGFGIFYKGRPGFGGFVALKLISPPLAELK